MAPFCYNIGRHNSRTNRFAFPLHHWLGTLAGIMLSFSRPYHQSACERTTDLGIASRKKTTMFFEFPLSLQFAALHFLNQVGLSMLVATLNLVEHLLARARCTVPWVEQRLAHTATHMFDHRTILMPKEPVVVG